MTKVNERKPNKFQCEECKFISSSKLMLERHMNGIHGIKQIESKKSISTKVNPSDIHLVSDLLRMIFGR